MSRHLVREPGHEARPPWMPDYRSTLRLLLLARLLSALHAGITDCDETYNYWEPLHLLTHPPVPLGRAQVPFQTWEYAPRFAIRSWMYVAQYAPIATVIGRALGRDKAASFYITRIVLGGTSSVCEATLLQTVASVVHPRVARYMLVLMVFAAGMYESTTALLPSTFAMYSTTLAMSFAFVPSTEGADRFPLNRALSHTIAPTRTLYATCAFALGALLAWPFALVLALPFVFEELFMPSGLMVARSRYVHLVATRIARWSKSVAIAALIGLPIFLIDTLAYGRPVFVPLNIITYNILSAERGAGPTLYGTEPWFYYLQNLTINFGLALPLALVSGPVVIFLSICAPSRISYQSQSVTLKATAAKKDDDADAQASTVVGTSPLLVLLLRLLPFYAWLGLLSLQPHKEERFMYPAYPLLCFNAAMGLYGSLALVSVVLGIDKGSQDDDQRGGQLLRRGRRVLSVGVLLLASITGISRSWQTTTAYHAPFTVLSHLTEHELPRVVAGHAPKQQSVQVQKRLAVGLPPVLSIEELRARQWSVDKKFDPYVDISLLSGIAGGQQQEPLRLCYGKEWHRFPGSYLVPNGVAIDFIASDFRGILPKHFATQERYPAERTQTVHSDRMKGLDAVLGWLWPWKTFTRTAQPGFNDMNREEPDRYVDVSACDYLVDVDWPHRHIVHDKVQSSREPRFAVDSAAWLRVHCVPFLDAVESRAPAGTSSRLAKVHATLERVFWLPAFLRRGTNRYGDYCLFRTTRRDSWASIPLSKMA